jgi:hypothetical protein
LAAQIFTVHWSASWQSAASSQSGMCWQHPPVQTSLVQALLSLHDAPSAQQVTPGGQCGVRSQQPSVPHVSSVHRSPSVLHEAPSAQHVSPAGQRCVRLQQPFTQVSTVHCRLSVLQLAPAAQQSTPAGQ